MRFTRARTSPAMRAEARSESYTIGAGYFWFYAGVGAFIPFTALYYRSLGFSGFELGILTALPSVGIALTGTFWGILADAFGWHRQIMRVVLALAALIPVILAQITGFAPFLAVLALLSVVLVPVPSLWDSYAVSAVERGGAPYGVLRIFGSLGFTAVVVVMGRVIADDLSPVFLYVYAACNLIAAIVALRLPALGERTPRKLWDGLRDVAQNRPYTLLLTVAYLITTAYAGLNTYLTIHVQSLGSDTSVAGIAFALAALSELPIIGFGTWILMRLGAKRVIIVALIMYILRFALLGFVPETSAVLFSQGMHGASFGMFLIASVTLAHRLVGRKNAATAQALLAMIGGFGTITGSLIGGIMIDITTTSSIYRGGTLLMTVALITFVIGSRLVARDAYDPPVS